MSLRFRLDGVLHHVADLPGQLASTLVARLKVLAELLTYRTDIPQEGRLTAALGRSGLDMRVSTFPTIHGEKVVVRIFGASEQTLRLDDLGFPPRILHSLRDLLAERSGVLFLTGPSGSGKTTTLYACLRHLTEVNRGGLNIVTIEDPVEQIIEGVSQSQARPGTDFDFSRGLRSLLRQDPEVLMVGEVRDPETAGVVLEAALTGHLVLSTIHAGSSCEVVSRLLDMGVEPYLLAGSLKGVVNQRLVRRLCDKCRKPTKDGDGATAWSAGGCIFCQGTGYRGRFLLAEFLQPQEAFRDAILGKAPLHQLEASAGTKRETLEQEWRKAVSLGWTSREEIKRVLGPNAVRPLSHDSIAEER
ncbi:MAG: GspE/PulE family protein [Gemmataceae bacterium]